MTKHKYPAAKYLRLWLARFFLVVAMFLQTGLVCSTELSSAKSESTSSEPATSSMPTSKSADETPTKSAPTMSPGSSSSPSIFPSIFALLFVIALLLGMTWFLKRIGVGATGKNGSFMKTLAVVNLGAREKIALVEIGETWLVLGITPSTMSTLHTLPKGSIELPGNVDTAQAFASLLERVKRPQKT